MFLELNHLSKSFGGKNVVRDLSLGLDQGELLCILGPSGCGKTTTLNMIGGFLTPDGGSILLDGQDLTRLPPERRPVSTVFQSYGLFPHMTALQNVCYGLKFRSLSREEARRRGMSYLELVGLADRHHHGLRHPRPGGGAGPLRPHRRDGGRGFGSAGPAGGALPDPRKPLCRPLFGGGGAGLAGGRRGFEVY